MQICQPAKRCRRRYCLQVDMHHHVFAVDGRLPSRRTSTTPNSQHRASLKRLSLIRQLWLPLFTRQVNVTMKNAALEEGPRHNNFIELPGKTQRFLDSSLAIY